MIPPRVTNVGLLSLCNLCWIAYGALIWSGHFWSAMPLVLVATAIGTVRDSFLQAQVVRSEAIESNRTRPSPTAAAQGSTSTEGDGSRG